MDSNGEDCSNKPGTSKEGEEDEDSSKSLDKHVEEMSEKILHFSEMYGLNVHATKGILHHACKAKPFLDLAAGKSDIDLPSIKVTRSMVKKKSLEGQSNTDSTARNEPTESNERQEEERAPDVENDEDADEGEESESEESLPDQDTEEGDTFDELIEDDEIDWNPRPKSVNLNDSAIHDDLEQTNRDLFHNISPGPAFETYFDPQYADFLCSGDLHEEEDDDTEYYPPVREYNGERRDEIYKDYFLGDIFDEEEEEEDPDYIIPLDEAVGSESESDGEGGRRRRRRTEIEISRKEVELLMKEQEAEKDEPTEFQQERLRQREYRKAAIEYRKTNKRPKRSKSRVKSTFEVSDDQSCSLLYDGLITFRQCEIEQLYVQLEQHVQLCVQGLAQCSGINYLIRDKNSYQEMINELEANYQEFGVSDPDSFFNIGNLPFAIDDCYEMQNVELISKEYYKWASSPTKIPNSFLPHPETCLVFSRSRTLWYPELVPYTQAPRIPVECFRFANFSPVDDTLLLLGLIQFGHVPSCSVSNRNGRTYMIMKHLLPIRPKKQIRERLASVRKSVCPNVLHQLILRAEEVNPSVSFTPAFPVRLEGATMIDWPKEYLPCWYEAFTKWFSVEDNRFIHFTGEPDPIGEPVRKRRRRPRPKKNEKDESFGKTNYVNVSRYLEDLREEGDEEAGDEVEEGEGQEEGRLDDWMMVNESQHADGYQDMPTFGLSLLTRVLGDMTTVPSGELEENVEKSDETTERQVSGEEEIRKEVEESQENENSQELSNSSPNKMKKKVVFLPLSPRNQLNEDPSEAVSTEESGAVVAGEVSHGAREGGAENMTRTTVSRRKQTAPMKKSPISREELRKKRKADEIKKKNMSPATKKLMDDLDMSDSDGENTKSRAEANQLKSNENQPPVSFDSVGATGSAFVFPEAATTSENPLSRSNSFIPATPHHRTPSTDVSLSPGLGSTFLQTPSPTFEGSQLPAPRTPRDDAMTRSPTLLRNMNMSSSLSYSYGVATPTPSARRRLRNVGPTDFSSIEEDEIGREGEEASEDPNKSPEPSTSTASYPPEGVCDMEPSMSSDKPPIGQRKWRKRGREEILKDGLEAMLDPTYRARQEAIISKHIFTDVKRRLSMHRDVLQKIEGIMSSEKGPSGILSDLESLLFSNHPDVLYLMSLMFDDDDIPPKLFSDPSRKAYRNAMDMILNIDSYCSRVKYKTSARNIFRILKTKCSEDTSPEDFVAEMRQFFGNDRPLWDVLKYHMPGTYNDIPPPQEFEYVDMRLMKDDSDSTEYEQVDAGRVLEPVANKRRNKFHVQHDKLFVNHGSGYVHAIVYKKPPVVPIPVLPEVSSPPSAQPKPPRKRKATNPKKSVVDSKPPASPPKPKKPDPPQWTKELDISILTAYNDISDDDEEAVVTALVPKIPYPREQISARLKFLLEQFQ